MELLFPLKKLEVQEKKSLWLLATIATFSAIGSIKNMTMGRFTALL